MAEHEEIELKWMLDDRGHAELAHRLVAELGVGRRIDQANRFYDTPERDLRRMGASVRLRFEGDRVLVTCKRRLGADDGLHRHREWEVALPATDWERLAVQRPVTGSVPMPEDIARAVDGRLELIGSFANLRIEHHDDADLLCLDRTTFIGGRVDHELEIETADPAAARARWGARLGSWGVAWRPQHETKLQRLLTLLADQSAGSA